jgi:biotin carboxylase
VDRSPSEAFTPESADLPTLAVFYDEDSTPIFELVRLAHGLCRLVWVVGWWPGSRPFRGLSRFGEVLDVTGMDDSGAVGHLAAQPLDGLLTYDDSAMEMVAAVAHRLGLPFHRRPTARLLADKLAQRGALRDAGLPVPVFAAVRAGDSDVDVPFPAVLKPRTGTGSRDTYQVESARQVAAALARCDPDEGFILEEWLPDLTPQRGLAADVVSIESVARDGRVDHLTVTGRFPFAPPFQETGSFMPSDLSPGDQEEVKRLAGAAIAALGIHHGIVHTEVKMTPAGPRIIEINGRLGGSVSGLLSRLGGPSMYEWSMKLALGHDVGPLPAITGTPIAFYRFLVAPVGATHIRAIEGADRLAALPGVDQVQVNRRPGDPVDAMKSSHAQHVVRVDGSVDSHAELADLVHGQISSTVRLTFEPSADTPGCAPNGTPAA